MKEFLAFCSASGEVRMTRARTPEDAALSVERAWKRAPRVEKFVRADDGWDVLIKEVPRHLSARENEDLCAAAVRSTRSDTGIGFRRVEMRYAFNDRGEMVSAREVI